MNDHDELLQRLYQARAVAHDAWLEAGGCEWCNGTGLTEKTLPCTLCNIEQQKELGIDPSLPVEEYERRKKSGNSLGRGLSWDQIKELAGQR